MIWGGEQGKARGGMLHRVWEEGGSAIDLQFGIRSACGGYFPRRSHNDISTILPFSPRPCAEETSPWSMSCCMPVKDDTKSSPPTGDILVPHICGGSCLSPRWIIGGVVGRWGGAQYSTSWLIIPMVPQPAPSSSKTPWSIPPRASPCSPPQITCSSPYISRSRARSLGAPLSWIWMRKTKYLPAGDPTRWSSPLNHFEPPPLQPTHGDDPRGHQRGSILISLTRSALEPLARVGQPWQEILVKVGAMGRYMDSQ